jgi:hypothetical protein
MNKAKKEGPYIPYGQRAKEWLMERRGSLDIPEAWEVLAFASYLDENPSLEWRLCPLHNEKQGYKNK